MLAKLALVLGQAKTSGPTSVLFNIIKTLMPSIQEAEAGDLH